MKLINKLLSVRLWLLMLLGIVGIIGWIEVDNPILSIIFAIIGLAGIELYFTKLIYLLIYNE